MRSCCFAHPICAVRQSVPTLAQVFRQPLWYIRESHSRDHTEGFLSRLRHISSVLFSSYFPSPKIKPNLVYVRGKYLIKHCCDLSESTEASCGTKLILAKYEF